MQITDNTFTFDAPTPNSTSAAVGIFINPDAGGRTTPLVIDGNTFTGDNLGSAIVIKTTSNVEFTNNSVTRTGSSNTFLSLVDLRQTTANQAGIKIDSNDLINQSANGIGAGILTNGDTFGSPTNTLSATFTNNNITGNRTGIAVDSLAGSNVVARYNALTRNTTGVLELGTTVVDFTRNWWDGISGPAVASNSGGSGQTIEGAGAASVNYAPWLVYSPDSNPSKPGVQLPATVVVTPGGDISAADNDFTRLQNAVGSLVSGQTLDIQGTFDWTATNATAAYAASTNTSATGDIRGVELADGVNNVTITSSTSNAHIIGKGDYEDIIVDSFLFADDHTTAVGNTNLTIEKLNIDDFENAVMFGWNGGGTYTGTKILDNAITVGGDNFGFQNVAIYFAAGTNQQVTGNTVNFLGDGTRAIGSGARSFGFQNNTTGGALYDGLLIDHNIFQVSASSNGVENVYGIWENGHNDDNNSHISITNNQFLGRAGDDFDRALVLSSQTTNLVIDANTFTDVDNVFYIDDFAGPSAGDRFSFTNNVLTRVGGADGVFLRNVSTGGVHVEIDWNINNTIDGETGARGLNELSIQATHASRSLTAATDLDVVNAIGTVTDAFVDDNWGSQGRFTDPDGIGTGFAGVVFGFNTYETIQEGIDAASTGATVGVLAGTYVENVLVNKSVTLLGPNASINPNTGVRGPEAIVVPATTDTDAGNVFAVTASNVTIKGFTIDGNNPSLTGGVVLNGVDVDAANGVSNADTFIDGLRVENNIIQNLYQNGVLGDLTAVGGTPSGDNFIVNNKIDNLPSISPIRGRGILVADNFYAEISGNVLTRVATGIQTDNYFLANPGAVASIADNKVDYYARGIFHNNHYGSASTWTISGNDITAEAGATSTNGGLFIYSIYGDVGVVVTDNDVTGAHFGIEIWNCPTTSTVTISGGTLTGNDVGILVTNNDFAYGAGAATTAVIRGVTILDSVTAGVDVDGGTAAVNNNTISANGTGIHITNGGSLTSVTENFVTGNTGDGMLITATAGSVAPVFDNDLSGNGGLAVNNQSATAVDAVGNWWGTSTAAVVAAESNGNVDFTAFLLTGEDTDLLKAGFQGNHYAPVAVNDSFTVDEDNTLNVPAPGVLGNDTDTENSPLTAILVSGPTSGSLTLNRDGSFSYTPNANFNGTDSFTYKANDGALDSNVVTVTITVNAVNDAPVNTLPGTATTQENKSVAAHRRLGRRCRCRQRSHRYRVDREQRHLDGGDRRQWRLCRRGLRQRLRRGRPH